MFYQRPNQYDYGYMNDFYGGYGFQQPFYYRQSNQFAIILVLFILLVIIGCRKC